MRPILRFLSIVPPCFVVTCSAACQLPANRPPPRIYANHAMGDPAMTPSAASSHGGALPAQPASEQPSREPLRDPSLPAKSNAASETVVATPGTEEPLRRAFANRQPTQSFGGYATYYHDSLAGNFTACGDKYKPSAFTAAHRTLPFGTILRVVHPASGSDVYVRVNDRGPFGGRQLVLDLSRAAAEKIGLLRVGRMKIRAEVLELGDKRHGRCGRTVPKK